MTKNVGTTERAIRVVAGLAILSLVFFVESDARWFGLIGLAPILTGLFGYCPPYAWMGINTCGPKTPA
ncbi:MAG: YgaP family membrane protein [Usitatibacter sp.]